MCWQPPSLEDLQKRINKEKKEQEEWSRNKNVEVLSLEAELKKMSDPITTHNNKLTVMEKELYDAKFNKKRFKINK